MNKSLIALALVGAFAAPAFAQEAPASPHTVTGNVSLATDYIFRGISQTNHKPAIQGGFDYSHASGLYAGTWASNVDWVSPGIEDNNSMEWDFYAGYKGAVTSDISYDLGVLQYYYPGDKKAGIPEADSTEIYAAASWKFLTLKYSHTVSSHLFGWTGYSNGTFNNDNTRGSGYFDLSSSFDLGNGWGVGAHIGHQTIKNNSAASYTDWKLGVTKDVGFGVVALAYTDTNAKGCGNVDRMYCWGANGDKDVGKARGVLSFSKSF
ncbi:MAG: TorF family putative porin [Azonexus sp.]|nr:TorF family putative porin [Azonexus sp.]